MQTFHEGPLPGLESCAHIETQARSLPFAHDHATPAPFHMPIDLSNDIHLAPAGAGAHSAVPTIASMALT